MTYSLLSDFCGQTGPNNVAWTINWRARSKLNVSLLSFISDEAALELLKNETQTLNPP